MNYIPDSRNISSSSVNLWSDVGIIAVRLSEVEVNVLGKAADVRRCIAGIPIWVARLSTILCILEVVSGLKEGGRVQT
jgi:hypothetical protein